MNNQLLNSLLKKENQQDRAWALSLLKVSYSLLPHNIDYKKYNDINSLLKANFGE